MILCQTQKDKKSGLYLSELHSVYIPKTRKLDTLLLIPNQIKERLRSRESRESVCSLPTATTGSGIMLKIVSDHALESSLKSLKAGMLSQVSSLKPESQDLMAESKS
jgi:hypothetical protein